MSLWTGERRGQGSEISKEIDNLQVYEDELNTQGKFLLSNSNNETQWLST